MVFLQKPINKFVHQSLDWLILICGLTTKTPIGIFRQCKSYMYFSARVSYSVSTRLNIGCNVTFVLLHMPDYLLDLRTAAMH
jgi:hypothetical protein